MIIQPLKLVGTYSIQLSPHQDDRGYFMRSYDEKIFESMGLQIHWVQENQSLSLTKHTLRGLHFQRPPYAETKLVRVLAGTILDVFVDLRKDSATYGQWDQIELSAANQKAVYIPRGFAHGFCTITEQALVFYKVDNTYQRDHEGGLLWNDSSLKISWPTDKPFLSVKDGQWPSFENFESPF